MQNDLISRNKLQLSLKRQPSILIKGKQFIRLDAVLEKVRIAPDIDAVPVVHGTWETSQLYDGDGNTVYIHRHRGCNYESRSYKEHGTPYCPNCGAKMDGGEPDAH